MKNRNHRNGLLLAGILILTSCSLAPRKSIPEPEYNIPDTFTRSGSAVQPDSVLVSKWWQSFQDETLNALIDSVFARNLDGQLALTRIMSLEANFKAARSQRLPWLTLSGSTTDSKQQFFMQNNFIVNEYTSYSITSMLSWELDVWGRVRDLEKAAFADVQASQADLRTLYDGLATQTAALYYDIRFLQAQVKTTQQTTESYASELSVQENRFEKGIGSAQALAGIQQATAASRMQLAQSEQLLAFSEHQLAVLLDEYPGEILDRQTIDLGFIDKMEPLPTGLPSELLNRRSDILSAEYTLEAARKRVGAARADYLPRISLTGSYGYTTQALEDLFKDDFSSYSVGGNVSGTYGFGSKKSSLNASRALYEQARLNYRKTVLNAFREVEDALITFDTRNTLHEQTQIQVKAVRDQSEIQSKRYQQGIGNFNTVMDAERNRLTLEQNLISAQKALLVSRISLHHALGGGFYE